MNNNEQKVGAIIVAAGESQRMEGIDKAFTLLGGEPLLLRANLPIFRLIFLFQEIMINTWVGSCSSALEKGEAILSGRIKGLIQFELQYRSQERIFLFLQFDQKYYQSVLELNHTILLLLKLLNLWLFLERNGFQRLIL